MGVDTDDIPDPHKVREDAHPAAVDLIDQNVSDFAAAIGYVLAQP